MIGNFHQSILIHWHELSPGAPLGPLKWLQVTSTEPAHSLQNNYPNPLSRPNPLTLMKCPPMQGADIFQQHQPLWNANQKSFLLKYMTLAASINRPSYIITTTIIKKHLQNTHLCVGLHCWAQNLQAHQVLTSGRNGYSPATSRFSCCLFRTMPRGRALQQNISGSCVTAPRELISCWSEQTFARSVEVTKLTIKVYQTTTAQNLAIAPWDSTTWFSRGWFRRTFHNFCPSACCHTFDYSLIRKEGWMGSEMN